MKTITYTKKDFAWTKWNVSDIKKVAERIVAHKKKKYAEIKKIPAQERTFENTIYAIEAADYDVMDNFYSIELLMNVSPKDEREGKEIFGLLRHLPNTIVSYHAPLSRTTLLAILMLSTWRTHQKNWLRI